MTDLTIVEQIALYNEGVDEILDSIRRWMVLEGIRTHAEPFDAHESVPELLNQIKDHFAPQMVRES